MFSDTELRDIDVQLTEIYKDYSEERDKHKVSDAEHLVYIARSQISNSSEIRQEHSTLLLNEMTMMNF